jgi:hypothetical protein
LQALRIRSEFSSPQIASPQILGLIPQILGLIPQILGLIPQILGLIPQSQIRKISWVCQSAKRKSANVYE